MKGSSLSVILCALDEKHTNTFLTSVYKPYNIHTLFFMSAVYGLQLYNQTAMLRIGRFHKFAHLSSAEVKIPFLIAKQFATACF